MEIWSYVLQEDACLEVVYKNIYRKSDLDLLSPSRHDGMSMEEENCLRRNYCQLLLEAGKRLKMCVLQISDVCKALPKEEGLQRTDRW